MSYDCAFFVPGTPRAKGSFRPIRLKSGGVYLKPTNKEALDLWTANVKLVAAKTWQKPPTDRPVRLSANFRFVRPKSHYRTGRYSHLLKDGAPEYPIAKNVADIDKLLRSLCDALTSVVIDDDSQVVQLGDVEKVYAEHACAVITIEVL